MKWSERERHQPPLADLGRQRLLDPGVVLVAGREYVRRGTTPTSLGQPEPRTDILVPD